MGTKGYIDAINGHIYVPKCFWKLVCYKDQSDNKIKVFGNYGENKDYRNGTVKVQDKNYHQIRTLRSQNEMIKMVDTLQKLFSKKPIKMWNNFIDDLDSHTQLRNPGVSASECASALQYNGPPYPRTCKKRNREERETINSNEICKTAPCFPSMDCIVKTHIPHNFCSFLELFK
jgi:RNA polymerase-interacting CarD/CdnL/TRCF family regulator